MTALDPGTLLSIALAVRGLAAVSALCASHRPAVARWAALVGSALASGFSGAAWAVALARGAAFPGPVVAHAASGLVLSYGVDPLAGWFLVVLAAVAAPVALYGLGYLSHAPWDRRATWIGVALNVLLAAVEMVFTATDGLAFLAAWEVMTLSTAALVVVEHEQRAPRRAAFLYLGMSHVGTGCLIGGFLLLAAAAGSTGFAAMLPPSALDLPGRHVVFALFFIGFGVKAGVIPLHIWLPEAHPAAPTPISALMSGVLIKTGIYGMVRFCAFGLGTPHLAWGVVVLGAGGVSAVLGVLYALMQHDLKRLLAYHSIENIGIILLGLGAGMIGVSYGRGDVAAVGVAACLYHTLNHALFKALLFLGAGNVAAATGTRQIEHYGGLMRRMPWTGAWFLVGAAAISGLPPLNGFASEWLTFQALLFGFRGSSAPLVHLLFPLGGALLALTAALAAACFVKAFGITFLALPRSTDAEAAVEAPRAMLVPLGVLSLLCVVLGLFPGAVLATLHGVLRGLPGVVPPVADPGVFTLVSGLEAFDRVVPAAFLFALLTAGLGAWWATFRRSRVRHVPTWACGGALTAQSEYTATAFSKPVMMIFRAIYRPTRKVESLSDTSAYFPREVRYRAEIEPTFERHVYGPLVNAVLGGAEVLKRLQAGSLHAYLAYVMALMVALVLLVWWRG